MVDIAIRPARMADAVKIAKMLRESLQKSLEGRFNIDPSRLLAHVQETIVRANGLALVLVCEGEPVGCFMANLEPHAYCKGYIARELGCYIKPAFRGGDGEGSTYFEAMFTEFVKWADSKPDVLYKVFTIGQLGATTPYLRALLKKHGFTKGDEGYYQQ